MLTATHLTEPPRSAAGLRHFHSSDNICKGAIRKVLAPTRLMAPPLATLAQSESKQRFMERLGLSTQVSEHKIIYGLMKAEAIKGRESMLTDRNVLLPHHRDDPAIQPPYSSSQVTDTAMRAAVARIYDISSPETRYYYDQGRDVETIDEISSRPSEENWIIRWMLWHVFRYRDSRNKHRAPSDASTAASSATTDYAAEPSTSFRHGSYSNAGGFRPANLTFGQSVSDDSQASPQHARPHGSLPYDPARDI